MVVSSWGDALVKARAGGDLGTDALRALSWWPEPDGYLRHSSDELSSTILSGIECSGQSDCPFGDERRRGGQ